MLIAKGIIRVFPADEIIPLHRSLSMKNSMGNHEHLMRAFASRDGVTVYVKEHNCAFIGWGAFTDVQQSGACKMVGAGGIQLGRFQSDFIERVCEEHRVKCVVWDVENATHHFIKRQLGFEPNGSHDIYLY